MARMRQFELWGTAALLFILACGGSAASASDLLTLPARTRVETEPGSKRWHSLTKQLEWKAEETAIVVCDMWDNHWCENSARRVSEMAPHMNRVIHAARQKGVMIVHCPSDTMDFYKDTPQRKLAMSAPIVETVIPLERWCRIDPEKEGPQLPIDDSDGGCDCEGPVKNYRAWSRQHAAIEIMEQDAITDSAEAFYLMKQKGIRNVIVMGVHTNMCVLGRPFSIRQMVRQGQNVVLMRDMTDTMYNPSKAPFVNHFTGNDLVVEHIEQYWCPTITSSVFTGEPAFRFSDDKRPHVVVVCSEPEYQTELSLPKFAIEHLGREFKVSYLFADTADNNLLPGYEVVSEADLLLLSMRRRTLPPEQLNVFRTYIAAGKPVLGIRTANHAFCLRDQSAPAGRADWREFDQDVIGGSYTNHWGYGPKTNVSIVSEQAGHPILQDLDVSRLVGNGSLYKVSPLRESAQALLVGTIPDAASEPIAWVNRRSDGGTTFYTSFGHIDDFSESEFTKLLSNAAHWLTRKE
ncbi:MAG: ThuA domain-containing protein [Planctomyces sp.]|nr:ThuA domain-containing protein [Planctomyces sp.]